MNTPGEAEGNWSYRITKEQLDAVDPARFARMNRLYGRQVEKALAEDEA
jgi:4-alpha-glucanotransferase